VERQILAINEELNWLYAKDRGALREKIREVSELPILERRRKRADILVAHQKYTAAIEAYKRILAEENVENPGHHFFGMVYHNMGVTYAKLFQFEEASACLGKAYENLHTRESLKDYLFCLQIKSGQEAFRKACEEYEVDETTRREMEEALAAFRDAREEEELQEPSGETLNAWVREYHRQTAY
jgi:tetratricopeptide (TPR) repeat protein